MARHKHLPIFVHTYTHCHGTLHRYVQLPFQHATSAPCQICNSVRVVACNVCITITGGPFAHHESTYSVSPSDDIPYISNCQLVRPCSAVQAHGGARHSNVCEDMGGDWARDDWVHEENRNLHSRLLVFRMPSGSIVQCFAAPEFFDTTTCNFADFLIRQHGPILLEHTPCLMSHDKRYGQVLCNTVTSAPALKKPSPFSSPP